jgi:hypothetical protein
MSVYKKLQQARIKLQGTKLSKSGKNKFAGYEYFELSDFLPTIQTICNDIGLCGVVSFNHEMAYLQINDVEDGTSIMFTSPMSSAALKGCHDVQNLGAVQTYLRRYLWTNAFEIVEHDALDATMGGSEPAKKPESLTINVKPGTAKVEIKPLQVSEPWQIALQDNADSKAWLETLRAGADALLQLATKPDDVKTIFKVNRVIFDKAKELDEVFYAEMMSNFSKTKNSLT